MLRKGESITRVLEQTTAEGTETQKQWTFDLTQQCQNTSVENDQTLYISGCFLSSLPVTAVDLL